MCGLSVLGGTAGPVRALRIDFLVFQPDFYRIARRTAAEPSLMS